MDELNVASLRCFELVPRKDATTYYYSMVSPTRYIFAWKQYMFKLGHKWAHPINLTPINKIPTFGEYVKLSMKWLFKKEADDQETIEEQKSVPVS